MKMMGRRNMLRFCMSIFLASFLLAGCSGAKRENPLNLKSSQEKSVQTAMVKSEQQYESTSYMLDAYGADVSQAKFMDGYVYVRCFDDDAKAWMVERIQPKKGQMEEVVNFNPPLEEGEERTESRNICCFDLTMDGGIVVLSSLHDLTEEGLAPEAKEFALTTFDKDGTELRTVVLEKAVTFPEDQLRFGMSMSVDGKGHVLVMSDGFTYLSADGKKLAETKFEENSIYQSNVLCSSRKGTVWVSNVSIQDAKLRKANFETGKMESLDGNNEIFLGVGSIFGNVSEKHAAGDLIAYTSDKVFLLNEGKKELISLLEWDAQGLSGNDVTCIGLCGEEVYAITRGQALLILSPREGDAERKIVLLATIQKTSLTDIVAAYNRSQKKYQVKVVEYGRGAESSLEWQEPANRMVIDILGDTPPDLIDMSGFLLTYLDPSPADFVTKEYVEDLYPYLERSQTLSKDMFEEKVLEICTYQGMLATIPSAYCFDTLLVSSEELGQRDSWTVSELIAYDRAHPEMSLVDQCTPYSIYSLLIKPNLGFFIDFEKGTADFDRPEFREMLEYAASYPMGEGYLSLYGPEKLVRLDRVEGVAGVQRRLCTSFDGKAQYIGYASVDGSHLTYLDIAADARAFSICKRGTEKEGAWDFIEFVQQYEVEEYTNNENIYMKYLTDYGGIPTQKRVLELVKKSLSKEDIRKYKEYFPDGTSYENHPLTEKELATFTRLLDSSKPADFRFRKIYPIIYEEIGYYFRGEKNLDQTIDVINQRVRLYLQEN